MSDTIRCPDCGAPNAAEAEACVRCNFPLGEHSPPKASPPAVAPTPVEATVPVPLPAPESASEPSSRTNVRAFDPGPRPTRPRRARPDALEPVQMQLWLVAGVAIVLGIVYFAAQGFWKANVQPPVVGASPEQQQRVELARRTIEQDSTNIAARIELANMLYDTANWSEAIVHYKSAERQDPMRATTVVDLGVCYYNLGQFGIADSLFTHALTLDPKQVVAMFNRGIIAESQMRWQDALDLYHAAMRANPPENMKASLMEHLNKMMAKTGSTPPPIERAK